MKKLLLLVSLLWSASTMADPINKIVYFGDSLTDNGNLHSVLRIIPKSPPYYEGRFSNGPTWADIIETTLSSKNIASSNYATGGATVYFHNPFDGFLPYVLDQEINHYLLQSAFADRSKILFVIWIAANDYTSGQKDVDGATTHVVNNIMGSVNTLINHGGKHFLILNLPDLSKIPFASTVDFGENLHQLSVMHNKKLVTAVNKLQAAQPDLKLVFLDTFSIFGAMLENPEKYNREFHKNIQNSKDSCWNGGYTLQKNKTNEVNALSDDLQKAITQKQLSTTPDKIDTHRMAEEILQTPSLAEAYTAGRLYAQGVTPCEKPDEFMFWDHVHPTASVHDIMAQITLQKLKAEELI